jgi:hypothetical protein
MTPSATRQRQRVYQSGTDGQPNRGAQRGYRLTGGDVSPQQPCGRQRQRQRQQSPPRRGRGDRRQDCRRQPPVGQQRQPGVGSGHARGPQAHRQRAFARLRIPRRVGQPVDEQDVRHQHRKRHRRHHGHDQPCAALAIVRALHDQPPRQRDRDFAQAARHQAQRRGGIRPRQYQPGDADGDQPAPGGECQPQPAQHHQARQAQGQAPGRRRGGRAGLDGARAAREGRQRRGVDRVRPAERVVIVVPSVGCGMGQHRQGDREPGAPRVESAAAGGGHGQPQCHGRHRYPQKAGTAQPPCGVPRQRGIGCGQ